MTIAMRELIEMANKSRIPEIVILLDCCHSGALGEPSSAPEGHALLREGVALLTASGRSQVSMEIDGSGIFSNLVCGALSGQAADLFGHVTVAGIYAHLEPYMGAWSQRPRFRANLRRLTPLRHCRPPVDFSLLRELVTLFESAETVLALHAVARRDNALDLCRVQLESEWPALRRVMCAGDHDTTWWRLAAPLLRRAMCARVIHRWPRVTRANAER